MTDPARHHAPDPVTRRVREAFAPLEPSVELDEVVERPSPGHLAVQRRLLPTHRPDADHAAGLPAPGVAAGRIAAAAKHRQAPAEPGLQPDPNIDRGRHTHHHGEVLAGPVRDHHPVEVVGRAAAQPHPPLAAVGLHVGPGPKPDHAARRDRHPAGGSWATTTAVPIWGSRSTAAPCSPAVRSTLSSASLTTPLSARSSRRLSARLTAQLTAALASVR
jgi:hypothetical protein